MSTYRQDRLKKVFVRPVRGSKVWYPAMKRHIAPEGEYVPARSRYWGKCEREGFLEIFSEEPEPQPELQPEPKPEPKPEPEPEPQEVERPTTDWRRSDLRAYAELHHVDLEGVDLRIKAEIVERIEQELSL